MTSAETENLAVPLCVDLDGTLINTDMVWESVKSVARRQPWRVAVFPVWLALGGWARFKRSVGVHARVDCAGLPYHRGFLEFLRAEQARGRRLILATASDESLARRVAERFGLFDEVLGSDGRRSLRGAAKAALLVERFGERGFDYAANTPVDLKVWARARGAVVVNGSDELVARARQVCRVLAVFPEEPGNPCRAPW